MDRDVRELVDELALPGTPSDRRWKRIVLPKLRRGGFEEGR